MIGVGAWRETLHEGHLAGASACGIEAIEAHRQLTGSEIEILHHCRMERISVTRRRERDHATVRRHSVRCARVRLAMREPDYEQETDGKADLFHHPMQPVTTTKLKQIFPVVALRSLRLVKDASW